MGLPSQQQIDEAIALGLSRGESEEAIAARIATLERLSDEELAEFNVFVGEAAPAAPPQPPATSPAPPATPTAPPAISPAPPVPFEPAPVRARRDGWTADRQRAFIATLAETGCVSEACAEVGISARSAYRLREHPLGAAFRHAWDHAQSLAAVRLTAIAWERAVHGAAERLYKNGELIAERRRPSDRLLMWLLAHHDPATYGWASRPPGSAPDVSFFPLQHARAELPAHLGNLADVEATDCPAEWVSIEDYDACDEPPSRA